jgi:hypothetical protein
MDTEIPQKGAIWGSHVTADPRQGKRTRRNYRGDFSLTYMALPMAHYYSFQFLSFVVSLVGLAVYYPLTPFDGIQGKVSGSILLLGYPDTTIRLGEKIAQGSSFNCTES